MEALVLASLLLLPPARATAAPVDVSIARVDASNAYHLTGRFVVEATTTVARSVITDYDGISRFVSSIHSSRVIKRQAPETLIEQEGTARFLFVSRPVRLILSVHESVGRVQFRDVGSPDLKQYEGAWTFSPAADGCAISYELTAEPIAGLAPRFATKKAVKSSVRRLLGEVRAEIERRARE